jgi:myo-inositol-1(or 4)-monophosphatase
VAGEDILERLATAQRIGRLAGRTALELSRNRAELVVTSKGVQDRVTDADVTTEREIRQGLAAAFPDDAFMGEEAGGGPAEPGRGLWVVDPIDGTDCFVFGLPSWSISIAWVSQGEVKVGVVFDPIHDEMFACALGRGAFVNGRPMRVSQATEATAGLVGIGHSNRVKIGQTLGAIERLAGIGGMFHRCGSGALSLAWVAAGRLIGYFEPHMNAWDCLAGLLLVREAGGWTNDFLANDGLTNGNPAIAAGPGLVDKLLHVSGLEIGAQGAHRVSKMGVPV